MKHQEEEKFQSNDNVNYVNDFQYENKDDMKDINYISNTKFRLKNNSIAVYSIIRNNERSYELACFKRGGIAYERYHYFDIVIYDILSNKITNKICEVFIESNDEGKNIKHYYYSSTKKHFLLSSSKKFIKLWNISSKIIKNE